MRRRFYSPGSVLCPHTAGPPELFVKFRGSRRSSGDACNSAPGPEVGEGTGPPGRGECRIVAAIPVMGPCGLEWFLSPPLSSPAQWRPATWLPPVVSAGWGGPLREELRRWGTPGSSRELSPGRPRAQEEEGAWGGGGKGAVQGAEYRFLPSLVTDLASDPGRQGRREGTREKCGLEPHKAVLP